MQQEPIDPTEATENAYNTELKCLPGSYDRGSILFERLTCLEG